MLDYQGEDNLTQGCSYPQPYDNVVEGQQRAHIVDAATGVQNFAEHHDIQAELLTSNPGPRAHTLLAMPQARGPIRPPILDVILDPRGNVFQEPHPGPLLLHLPTTHLEASYHLGLPHNISGQEVQQLSVVGNLPDLLQDHYDDCMRRVLPKVREVLRVADAEMQAEACKAFLQVLQNKLVPLQHYSHTFLQTIVLAIDSKDPDVANAWLETLLDVIDLLPKDAIKKEILGVAISKGQLSQTVQSRLSCCLILGKIATKFEPFVIKKDILPIVQSLCQDVDYEVRGCMCRQLDAVARGLGLDATKNAILPELVELTNDEESFVRLAGLETVVNLLSLLDEDTHRNTIIPLVCKFCEQAIENEDSTLPMVAKQIGKLCHGLSANISKDEHEQFLSFFCKMCKIGLSKNGQTQQNDTSGQQKPNIPVAIYNSTETVDQEEDQEILCRKHVAFNFPAMVLFVGVRHFQSDLHSVFSAMCQDPSPSVRKSMSAGFHEIAKLLGNNAIVIEPELVTLLSDDSLEALKGLLSHLSATIELMIKAAALQSQEMKLDTTSEIIGAVIQCDTMLIQANNWRLQSLFVEQLCDSFSCFTSEQIYQKLAPLLFKKLQTARALPVKTATVRTVLSMLKHIKKQELRSEICRRLVEDLCFASNCYRRTLFVDTCIISMELFSRSFFKQHFFEALLELSSDPVANIRLRLCPLLPKLKVHIKLPTDRQLLQLLETNVRKMLLNEKDADVAFALQKAVESLDRVKVQMESLTKKAFLEDDIADQKKEEEERKLIEQEEKEKREEEVKSAKGERGKKDVKKDSPSKLPTPKKATKIPMATSLSSGKSSASSASSTSSRAERPNGSSASREKVTKPEKSQGKTSRTSRRESEGSPRGLPHRSSLPTASSVMARSGSASSVSSSGSNASRRGSTGSAEATKQRRASDGSDVRRTGSTAAGSVSNLNSPKKKPGNRS